MAPSRIHRQARRPARAVSVRWLALLPLLLACLSAPSLAADKVNILIDLRLGLWMDRVRLVLETDGELGVRFSHDNTMLHLNLADINQQSLMTALDTVLPVDHDYIEKASSQVTDAGTRLDLKLRQAVHAEVFKLAPEGGFGHRWVLDLFPRSAPRVTAARIGEAEERTRIVLESKHDLGATLVMLSRPRQLLLELDNTASSGAMSALVESLAAGHPYISSLEVQAGEKDSLQLLVNLRGPVRADMFALKPFGSYDHRLVLDVYPQGGLGNFPEPATRSEAELAEPSLAPPDPPAAEPAEIVEDEPTYTPTSSPSRADPATPDYSDAAEGWYEVQINDQSTGHTALALVNNDGSVLLDGRDLREWRLVAPPASALEHLGSDYYPLAGFPGLSYQLNERRQEISITVPAGLFESSALTGRSAGMVKPDPSPLGGFLNYQLAASGTSDSNSVSGFLDLGAFNGWGAARSKFLARSESNSEGDSLIRLDSTWTRDDPASLRSLRLGDAITRSSSWGGAVRFGGLQWGRNFDTQPGFVTLPLPGMSGEAALPSTVDLYINDALRLRREVPSGPFSIQDLPIVTGRGEARMVVRDLLGNEQVITEDYYASSSLLRKGLHDYSYEAGMIREDYGRASNNYGRALAVGTHRYGFSNSFTAEIHGEFLEDQQSIGLGADWLLPFDGVLSTSLAASDSHRGSGQLFSLGIQRQGDWLNVGAESQLSTRDFVRLGMTSELSLPRQQSRAYLSFSGGKVGSFGLSYTQRDHYIESDFQRDDVRLVSANYRLRLGGFGSLSVSAIRSLESGETSLNLHLSLPISAQRTSASISRSSGRGEPQNNVQIQRSLPAGSGVGYHLRAGQGASDYQRGGISARSNTGSYSLEAARSDEQTSYQIRAGGSLAAAGGALFHGRELGESFGVVRVPGFANVRIYAENQLIGKTNGQGYALVPRLRPYEQNRLAIEQADLPMSAQIRALEIKVVPRFGSAVLADFPVTQNRDGLLRLFLDDGEPLPLGAVVVVEGQRERFPVGYGGELYLTGLEDDNVLTAYWEKRSCRVELAVGETDDPLPDLGDHHCRQENYR